MGLKFTILGCGNSSGVPAAGNYWGKCNPNTPQNRRTRPSLLVETAQTKIVIDTGPDFSFQATKYNLTQLDAVLYTHSHGDHVHGIDDLKRYIMNRPNQIMDIYTNDETIIELKRRFYYLFQDGEISLYKKALEAHSLNNQYGKNININDINFIPFEQQHGPYVQSVGFRFDKLAYSTDVKTISNSSIETLKGIDTWIIDAAGYHQDNNPVHANLNEIYAMNEIVQAKQVYLTSLSLAMDYNTLISELPTGYTPAHDGLVLGCE